ncbi:O-antigen ligase family protein [Rubrobacter calidifluminis]|uniref:O-antigen ligase family protein n=1 Tax=Rubrobacter calidifluminis TaxID=1392640 RepID=UPI00236282E7|nr:O-antigen ligase family protein [Rubrobacter calidifluminis]
MSRDHTVQEGYPTPTKDKGAGRSLAAYRAFILDVLLAVTCYGMIREGLYTEQLWLPVAAGIFALLFVTLFVGRYLEGITGPGWVLTALLAVLAGVKGVSLLWTASDILTVEETMRSSMYLATFLLSSGALCRRWQPGIFTDLVVLAVLPVCIYGLLQKAEPIRYPVTSIGGVRVDSTLGYANTTAIVMAMAVLLILARMSQVRNALLRGLYAVFALAYLTTLYLTVSRGGLGSMVIGVVVLLALTGRRLGTLVNLVLLAVPGLWLVRQINHTRGLMENVPDPQKLAAAGAFRTDLALALVAAFVLQLLYALLANRYSPGARVRRLIGAAVVCCALLGLLVGAGVLVEQHGGPVATYQALVNNPDSTRNVSDRLTSASIGFRKDYWEVAWQEWKAHPLTGSGAGTFQYTWLKHRPDYQGVKQVHNLYLEQGTETGLFAFLAIVGFAVYLVFHTVRQTLRADPAGERRLLLAGMSSAIVAYLVSSAFEWHWYIPSSTLLFFTLAGVAVKLASMREWDPGEEEP